MSGQRVTPEAIAEALIQYETGGMCHFGQTCGLCDCGKADETPERTQTRDAMDLDRARAVLAVLPAALPSEDEAARAIARASDVEWDYNPEDPEDTYRRDARAVLALIPPQRCAPSEDEVKAAVLEHFRHTEYDQPTVAVAQAQALRRAARLMGRCKETGHWNLRDLEDDGTWHSPDRWLEVLADRIEVLAWPDTNRPDGLTGGRR